jgi:hypothetical protein
MPFLEGVGKPILSGNRRDENQKRKFLSRLWHLIAASLFLPLIGRGHTPRSQKPEAGEVWRCAKGGAQQMTTAEAYEVVED